jgi:hypothetical protein
LWPQGQKRKDSAQN